MEGIPQTRKGLLKLFSEPVQVDVFLKYKTTGEGTDIKFVPDESDESFVLKAWLHPMTANDWADCEAVGVEAYRHFRAKGGSPEDSMWRGNRLQNCQQILICLRVSPKKDAKALFEDEIEVLQLDTHEIDRLIREYVQAFQPDKDESKNCLRERLGQGSGTPSTSPDTSATQG
jgi:hypothetical protein